MMRISRVFVFLILASLLFVLCEIITESARQATAQCDGEGERARIRERERAGKSSRERELEKLEAGEGILRVQDYEGGADLSPTPSTTPRADISGGVTEETPGRSRSPVYKTPGSAKEKKISGARASPRKGKMPFWTVLIFIIAISLAIFLRNARKPR